MKIIKENYQGAKEGRKKGSFTAHFLLLIVSALTRNHNKKTRLVIVEMKRKKNEKEKEKVCLSLSKA
jgi:hypothetical protein